MNGIEIYKFKAKDSEIVASPLCLGNISKDWSTDMKKQVLIDMSMILVLIMLLQLMTLKTFKNIWWRKIIYDKYVHTYIPRNCKCEKSCDFGEYLDYENCKCRKRLVHKLIEECNENIEETSLIKINSTKCKSNSCILYIVLFSIFFTINIGIATYFIYYKYINHNEENVSKYDYVYQRKNY